MLSSIRILLFFAFIISCIELLHGYSLNRLCVLHSKLRIQSRYQLHSNKNEKSVDKKDERKLTFGAVFQLILMGAGAPGLGEYKGTDEKTGKMFFELESNNLYDSNGNDIQQRAKFFKEGWVEDSEIEKAPGFFQNLLSGGKLQQEWDEKFRKSK